MSNIDLDKGGRKPQNHRTYLGPTVGWVYTDEPTYIEWVLDDKIPDEHVYQVEMGMAATGCDAWHFLAFCPGEPSLLKITSGKQLANQTQSCRYSIQKRNMALFSMNS